MNYIAKKIALQEKNILNHADLYLDYNKMLGSKEFVKTI